MFHSDSKWLYILEGTLQTGERFCRAGDFIHADGGSIHAPSTVDGFWFLVHTSMDDGYLQPLAV